MPSILLLFRTRLFEKILNTKGRTLFEVNPFFSNCFFEFISEKQLMKDYI